MQAKTYSVGTGGIVRRLDNLSSPWINVSPSLVIPNISNYDLYDVETDPNNGNKVFVVGVGSTSVSAFGIYVSFDGGTTWIIPGGNYQTAFGAAGRFNWNEVSVVDSNTIWVCGDGGNVVVSNDGGLTFTKVTLTSAPTANIDARALHFLSSTVGVVSLREFVLKTINGGATWIILNGGFPLTGSPNYSNGCGIHISQDLQSITAVSESAIYHSSNAGVTFTRVYTWPGIGIHLTWTDDQNLWAFGANNQKVRSTDGGLTWSVITAYAPSSPNHRAGHFYQGNNGFYSGDSITYSTNDGAITGIVSDNFPSKEVNAIWTWFDPSTCYRLISCEEGVQDIIVTNDLSASIGKVIEICPTDLPAPAGTSGSGSNGIPLDQVPPPEEPEGPGVLMVPQYNLTDCCGIQPTLVVHNNLAPYLNGILYIPALGNTCWIPTPRTINGTDLGVLDLTGATYYNECETCNEDHGCNYTPDLAECGCYTVAVAESCLGAITLQNIGLVSDTCLACSKKCYYITDCTNDLNVIQTGADLSSYVGKIITLKDCPDTCWLVSIAPNCDEQSCISEVTESFETCIACLPPVIPTPFELHSRKVKPGYDTPGCSPEYTEKVNCNYGEQMYDKMLASRYGLTQCCAEDFQKWDIKKSLLDLRAIYDPELCKCVIKPKCCPPYNVQAFIIPPYVPPVANCVCWTVHVETGFITVEYIDCLGELNQRNVAVDDTLYACTPEQVTAVVVNPGSIYSIEQSSTPCSTDFDCVPEPPLPCLCYEVIVTKGKLSITWVGCDSSIRVLDLKEGDHKFLCCKVGPSIVSVDPGSEYSILSSTKACITDDDCNTGECNPPSNVIASISVPASDCKCYQITTNTEGCTVNIHTCKDEEVIYSGLTKGVYYFCAGKPPTSNCFTTEVKDLGVCEGGFCTPNITCGTSSCCCFEIVANKNGEIMYLDCDKQPKILSLNIGTNRVCAQALYYGPFGGITSAAIVGPCDETCVVI